MTTAIQDLQKDIYHVFEQYPIAFAYLFGSIAQDTSTPKSDADIAVLLSKNLSKEERFEIRLALMRALAHLLKRDVDVIILNDTASLFFKYVILKEGKLLYEGDEDARYTYESMLLSLYFDFQPFLNEFNHRYVAAHLQ